jgi:hypothetical protein
MLGRPGEHLSRETFSPESDRRCVGEAGARLGLTRVPSEVVGLGQTASDDDLPIARDRRRLVHPEPIEKPGRMGVVKMLGQGDGTAVSVRLVEDGPSPTPTARCVPDQPEDVPSAHDVGHRCRGLARVMYPERYVKVRYFGARGCEYRCSGSDLN